MNDPDDCRRWDRLFVNDGNGNYTDRPRPMACRTASRSGPPTSVISTTTVTWTLFSTTHSTTLHAVRERRHRPLHGRHRRQRPGRSSGFFLQGKMEDMDNDGFLDIMTGSAEHFFKGNGDGTFTADRPTCSPLARTCTALLRRPERRWFPGRVRATTVMAMWTATPASPIACG